MYRDADYKPVSTSIFLEIDKKNVEEQKQREEEERKRKEKKRKEEEEKKKKEEEAAAAAAPADTTAIEIPNEEPNTDVKTALLAKEPAKTNYTIYAVWVTCIVLVLLACLFLIYWLCFLQ